MYASRSLIQTRCYGLGLAAGKPRKKRTTLAIFNISCLLLLLFCSTPTAAMHRNAPSVPLATQIPAKVKCRCFVVWSWEFLRSQVQGITTPTRELEESYSFLFLFFKGKINDRSNVCVNAAEISQHMLVASHVWIAHNAGYIIVPMQWRNGTEAKG